MQAVVFDAPYEHTPAMAALVPALAASNWTSVVEIIDRDWAEIWYAVDPSDLRVMLTQLPDEEAAQLTHGRFLLSVAGLRGDDPYVSTSADPDASVETAAQRMAELRLNGQPLASLRIAERMNGEIVQRRGRLVDTTQGKAALWSIQVAISALLAGDLRSAKGLLLAATESHRPRRFPFVRREAAAKLALTHALAGKSTAARDWADRARALPRTASWVEPMIDDSLWLVDYVLAVDSLDLHRAEEMRLARPSPLDHLEFWGIALITHVRHLALTARHAQAESLHESIAALGLPLPRSDGWLAHMLSDSRLHALPHGDLAIRAPQTTEAVLAQRFGAFVKGQLPAVVAPVPSLPDEALAVRAELGLRILRVQAFHTINPTDATRSALLGTLAEVWERDLPSTVRYVSSATAAALADTAEGSRLADLIRLHDLRLLEIAPVTSEPLTPAESTVLEYLAAGHSRQQIATQLTVSLSTVKSHLRTSYRKLGATNRAEALAALELLVGTADP